MTTDPRPFFTVTIVESDRGPAGKLADAELVFTDHAGPLAGLRLVGFGVWQRRTGERTITAPARQYTVNGERRSYALLRPARDGNDQDAIRQTILDAYALHIDGPARTPEPDPTPRRDEPPSVAYAPAISLPTPAPVTPRPTLFDVPEASAVTLEPPVIDTPAALTVAAEAITQARAVIAPSGPIPLIATTPGERAVFTPPSLRRRQTAPVFQAGTAAATALGLL
jgi:hypothetical protein